MTHLMDSGCKVLFCLLFCWIGFMACQTPAPDSLDIGSIRWATYVDRRLGVTFEYPDAYTIHEEVDGSGAIFRLNGKSALLLRYVNEAEGDNRGLWFGHEPVGEALLGGQAGQKYFYKHYDGPFFSRTLAYVVPYRGKFIALEIRTDAPLPDETQQYILDSFRFE